MIVKISRGVYEYNGYRLNNCGYHRADHCRWWEAMRISDNVVMYHSHTRDGLMKMIDGKIKKEGDKNENKYVSNRTHQQG